MDLGDLHSQVFMNFKFQFVPIYLNIIWDINPLISMKTIVCCICHGHFGLMNHFEFLKRKSNVMYILKDMAGKEKF